MTFGEKLRQSRQEKKMTQKQLADLVGAKHNSVSDWENNKNKPDPDTIELLCGILEITPNYLLNANSEDFSYIEKEMIRKFRKLDETGQELVASTLDKVYRMQYPPKMPGQPTFFDFLEEQGVDIHSLSEPMLNAAHADNYANAPEELKKEEEDMMDNKFSPE